MFDRLDTVNNGGCANIIADNYIKRSQYQIVISEMTDESHVGMFSDIISEAYTKAHLMESIVIFPEAYQNLFFRVVYEDYATGLERLRIFGGVQYHILLLDESTSYLGKVKVFLSEDMDFLLQEAKDYISGMMVGTIEGSMGELSQIELDHANELVRSNGMLDRNIVPYSDDYWDDCEEIADFLVDTEEGNELLRKGFIFLGACFQLACFTLM